MLIHRESSSYLKRQKRIIVCAVFQMQHTHTHTHFVHLWPSSPETAPGEPLGPVGQTCSPSRKPQTCWGSSWSCVHQQPERKQVFRCMSGPQEASKPLALLLRTQARPDPAGPGSQMWRSVLRRATLLLFIYFLFAAYSPPALVVTSNMIRWMEIKWRKPDWECFNVLLCS